jgi:hypothetical protein
MLCYGMHLDFRKAAEQKAAKVAKPLRSTTYLDVLQA